MLLVMLFTMMAGVGLLCIWVPKWADKLMKVFFSLAIVLFVSSVILVLV